MKHLWIAVGLLLQTAPPACVPQYSVVNVQNAINAALGCAAYVNSETDAFIAAGPPYTLNNVPLNSPAPMVFVNGSLKLLGTDYTIQNATVTFPVNPNLGAPVTIQVLYWYRP